MEQTLHPASTPNLSLLPPGSPGLDGPGRNAQAERLGRRLRVVLAELSTRFDTILLDCPPGAGLPLALAMTAGEHFVVPSRLEHAGEDGSGALYAFLERLIELRRTTPGATARLLGIVLTNLNSQIRDAAAREARLREAYGSAVFATVIRRKVAIERAHDGLRTIFQEDPRLRTSGAQSYRDLAAEVLIRGAAAGAVRPETLTPEVRLRARRLARLASEQASAVGTPLQPNPGSPIKPCRWTPAHAARPAPKGGSSPGNRFAAGSIRSGSASTS